MDIWLFKGLLFGKFISKCKGELIQSGKKKVTLDFFRRHLN